MEYKEVKELIDGSLEPVKKEISEIKERVEPIPALVERLTSYKDIEDSVRCHDFILIGTKENPGGIVNDIKELKTQGKKIFNWIVKVAALAGTILGLFATIRTFF